MEGGFGRGRPGARGDRPPAGGIALHRTATLIYLHIMIQLTVPCAVKEERLFLAASTHNAAFFSFDALLKTTSKTTPSSNPAFRQRRPPWSTSQFHTIPNPVTLPATTEHLQAFICAYDTGEAAS